MNTDIHSKHGIVATSTAEIYMRFVDMRNFAQLVPESYKNDVRADYDSLHAVVQGFDIGVKVTERVPYSRLAFADDGAPFQFAITVHFDEVAGEPDKTDFSVDVAAELNFLMKTMLVSRIKEGLDKMVDGLASAKM